MRDKPELKWAPDSIFFESDDDTSTFSNSSDPEKQMSNPTVIEKTSIEKEVPSTEKNKNTSDLNSNVEKLNSQSVFTEPKAITLEQAFKLFNRGITFVDARDEADFIAGHITNSINIPFDDFGNHSQKLEQLPKENPIVIYCAGTDCDLSILLGNLLFSKGYKQVYVFFGGWIEWQNADYPIKLEVE